jgi:hydroxyethylthiazole kinase-like uncharacterized protein yjeF
MRWLRFCFGRMMKAITKKYIRILLKPRKNDSYKGTYGHSLLIAGNTGTMGAAVIAAKACLRTGTGLLTVNVPEDERVILQIAVPEAMVTMRKKKMDLKLFSAIGIGPGFGTGASQKKLLETILKNTSCPLVLDADALNILAGNKALWKFIPASTIITPHPKEFDRLFGAHTNQEARIKKAIAQAKALNVIIVLKGHQTVVTSGVESFYNTSGNAGLAKGGSGDALTGMITALLAQGFNPLEAAMAAVYLHGLAADLSLKEQSMESMMITDVIDHIGQSFYAVAT